MPVRILGFCLLLLLFPIEALPQSEPADTTAARVKIEEWETELAGLDRHFKKALWDLYTTGELGDLPDRDAERIHFLNDPEIYEQLSQWSGSIKDPVLKRKIVMLHRLVLEAMIDNYGRLYSLLNELAEVQTNFRATFEGRETEDGELGAILRHDADRTRRRRAFYARATVGDEIGEDLARLFAMRGQAAEVHGFGDYYTLRLSIDEVDPAQLKSIMRLLEEMTRPAYESFLVGQKEALGIDTIEAWDLLYDSSGITSEIESYLQPDSMVARTRRTYAGLGFDLDALSITMDLEPREGKSQHAMCVAVSPPNDVRILANSREGLLSSELMLHEMGHAVHAASIRQEGHLLRDWPSGSFGEGIGEFFGQLVYTKEWLVTVAGVPEDLAVSYLEWRQDRRLFTVRWYLAALDFEETAYQNPEADLSLLYWDMLQRYLLIPTHPEVKVWAQIPHFITHPVYLQNYIFADLIAAQLRASLRERFGGLVNQPGLARVFINGFFKNGAAYTGEDLLFQVTGSPIDPKHFAAEF